MGSGKQHCALIMTPYYRPVDNKISQCFHLELSYTGAVVVAQLEQLLPTSVVRSSNPVISKFYIEHLCTVNCVEKTKIKKNGPLKITLPHV